MNPIGLIVSTGTALFGRLSFCAKVGALIGLFSGFLFGIVQAHHNNVSFTNQEMFTVGIILAIICWLIVLLIVGVWLRYGAAVISGAVFINAVFTALLTVFINNAIMQPMWAWLIGLIVGIIVGTILCLLCERLHFFRGKQHG